MGLNWSRQQSRNLVARRGSEQARPLDKTVRDKWNRTGRKAKPRSPHEVRTWFLECEDCGHAGQVRISIVDLRRAVAAGRVHCSECGVVRTKAF